MEFSAQQIADMLGGQIEGDPQVKVNDLAKIEEGKPGTLTFLANMKYERHLYDTAASIVIIDESFQPEQAVRPTLVKVKDAYGAFAKLLEAYDSMQHSQTGIHPTAFVSDSAQIGDDVYIGAHCCIGDEVKIGKGSKVYENVNLGRGSQLGENCLIFSGVQVYRETKIGNQVTIHSGSVIGCDGFGFAPKDNEAFHKVAQIGNVVIEDQVEIGSNVSIDRATLGSTIIRRGVKLDNLIQVAHNVEIGENTVIAAQSGIAGSTKIGKHCMIAGQVGIIGHLNIGDRVKIAAQSGVSNDLEDDAIVQGSPAYAVGAYTRSYVYFKNLPKLAAQINSLTKKIKP